MPNYPPAHCEGSTAKSKDKSQSFSLSLNPYLSLSLSRFPTWLFPTWLKRESGDGTIGVLSSDSCLCCAFSPHCETSPTLCPPKTWKKCVSRIPESSIRIKAIQTTAGNKICAHIHKVSQIKSADLGYGPPLLFIVILKTKLILDLRHFDDCSWDQF